MLVDVKLSGHEFGSPEFLKQALENFEVFKATQPGYQWPEPAMVVFYFTCERVEFGVYSRAAGNLNNFLGWFGFQMEACPETDAMAAWVRDPNRKLGAMPRDSDAVSCYGSADNVDQIKAYLAYFLNHPTRQFVLSVNSVSDPKAAAYTGDGPYVGTTAKEEAQELLVFRLHEILGMDADSGLTIELAEQGVHGF